MARLHVVAFHAATAGNSELSTYRKNTALNARQVR